MNQVFSLLCAALQRDMPFHGMTHIIARMIRSLPYVCKNSSISLNLIKHHNYRPLDTFLKVSDILVA